MTPYERLDADLGGLDQTVRGGDMRGDVRRLHGKRVANLVAVSVAVKPTRERHRLPQALPLRAQTVAEREGFERPMGCPIPHFQFVEALEEAV